ncbi:hypothetical protein LTR95_016374 [Oleoguttula sp. CCFEE 5521]
MNKLRELRRLSIWYDRTDGNVTSARVAVPAQRNLVSRNRAIGSASVHTFDGYETDPLDAPLLPKRSQAHVTPVNVTLESVADTDKEDRIAKARVVFGARLASPVERWDAIKRASTNIAGVLVPPRPEEPDNCCMSGCVNCVWDLFRDELEEWAAKKAEAREKVAARRASEAAVSMDDDGGGSDTNWHISREDSEKADLFEGIPVGIRAFMETEKKLKLLHKQQERAQSG